VISQSLLLLGAIASACLAQSSAKTFAIDTRYGTLSFRGTVDKVDNGSKYVIHTRVSLTFDKTQGVNRADRIDLTTLALVATRKTGTKNSPTEVLYRSAQTISAQFTKQGDALDLPELEFTIDKAVVEKATFVGLNVSDGKILWPIAVDLR
jgi:hypothetical protein